MIINVSDDYRIVSDSMEWQVQERRTVKAGKAKGQKKWDCVGHYMHFAGAINGLTNYRIRTIEGAVIDQIKAAVFRIESESRKTILDFAKETP